MPDSEQGESNLSPLKKALVALKQLQGKLDQAENTQNEPIAIVGASCRFPGDVRSLTSFWDLLDKGTDAISPIPPDRFDVEQYYDPSGERPGSMYIREGGFIDNVGDFDPSFFSISPKEALHMDPQQRLLLEVAWEALENSGVSPGSLHRTPTGVFLGLGLSDYGRNHFLSPSLERLNAYSGTGTFLSVASGRIAYFLGLNGPAVTVDTACSSSLVGVHLACQSLRSGETNVALAGGSNLILSPAPTIYFCQLRAMSPTGRCRTFDAQADGYVRGEGCAIIVLKRLKDAVKNKDPILAVIRGSAINQDGRSNGLTAPSGYAQKQVIQAALAQAKVDPKTVSMVEAHGTGTPLGDPIEFDALHAVYGLDRDPKDTCFLGSVKTNIGHLENTAGIAGLLKVVASLNAKAVPAHLHLETINPRIHLDQTPFLIPKETTAWDAQTHPRRAAVSSFGLSGTNAHMILEEAPLPAERTPSTDNRPVSILTLSSHDPAALNAHIEHYIEHLTHSDDSWEDIAHASHTTRSLFPHRIAVLADSKTQAITRLTQAQEDPDMPGILSHLDEEATEPSVAFLFTGAGPQYPGMAKGLYDSQPVFRDTLNQCAEYASNRIERPLLDVLFPKDPKDKDIHNIGYTQPIMFAFEVALYEMYRSWGLHPTAVMGHSVGEFSAAYAAGVFSLEEGMALMCERGRLMNDLPGQGGMLAVFSTLDTVKAHLESHQDQVSVGAINHPGEVVISGFASAVDDIQKAIETEGIECRRLKISMGAHSPHTSPMLDPFKQAVEQVSLSKPRIPLISNVTGTFETTLFTDPDYWRRHVRETVKFQEGLDVLMGDQPDILVEIGPKPTLLGMAAHCLVNREPVMLPSLRDDRPEWEQLLETLGTLEILGAPLQWSSIDAPYGSQAVSLPNTTWNKSRFWLDPVVYTSEGESKDTEEVLHGDAHTATTAPTNPWQQKWQSTPEDARPDILQRHIQGQVARVLGYGDVSQVKPAQGFFDAGMDSLMALDLRNRLQKTLQAELPPTLAFDFPSVGQLTGHLLAILEGGHQPTTSSTGPIHADAQDIAVISVACRFPGSSNTPEAFWRLLESGEEATTEIPLDRFDVGPYYDPTGHRPGKTTVKHGAFIDHVDQFDAEFFGISPREAKNLDPQQRLLLEVCWEALERAGILPGDLLDSLTGVFIGIGASEYGYRFRPLTNDPEGDAYAATGNESCFAAGRVAYTLGLRGPAFSINTACSSSLVAIHNAAQSLRLGECHLALCGGVNALLAPEQYIKLSQMQALAPDGRCKTFDASADGYGRGEGCGMTVLKRLADAERDGDKILSIIRATGMNHDGASSGLTVPSGQAQKALLETTLAHAGLSASDIDYLETHGTGTALGDPIEIQAVGQVLGMERPEGAPLLLGSVKANVGHLETGAGIASFIKMVLALQKGIVPPHPTLTTLNPNLPFDEFHLSVPTESTPWPTTDHPRRGAISSFGISGTNAHIILEAPPTEVSPTTQDAHPIYLLPLSGRTDAAMRRNGNQISEFLKDHPNTPLLDLCHTASTKRTHFESRAALVFKDRKMLDQQLAALSNDSPASGLSIQTAHHTPRVAFLFTGQGAQYVGMGRGLYDSNAVFQEAIDTCANHLTAHLDRPLKDILFGDDPEDPTIHQTAYTQPALFAVEYGLYKVWEQFGLRPQGVAGHSIGEYVAAHVAGVFSLEDALGLVAARGRLMQSLPAGGAMLAVFADEKQVEKILKPYKGSVSLAAINGPEDCVISGDTTSIDTIAAQLEAQSIQTRALKVSHAFHSSLMDPILEEFTALVTQISLHPPRIPLLSNVTGTFEQTLFTKPTYYRDHIRSGVRFFHNLNALIEDDFNLFVEAGPHPVLCGMGQRSFSKPELSWVGSLHRKKEDGDALMEGVAGCYVAGAPLKLQELYPEPSYPQVPIPTYAFEPTSYWVEIKDAEGQHSSVKDWVYDIQWEQAGTSSQSSSPISGTWIFLGNPDDPVCEDLTRVLADHDVQMVSCQIEQLAGHLQQAAEQGTPCTQIIGMWTCPPLFLGDADAEHIEQQAVQGCETLLSWMQTLEAIPDAPSMVFVTRGAQIMANGTLNLGLTPLCASTRIISLEHPSLLKTHVDLPLVEEETDGACLLRAICQGEIEDQIAVRDSASWFPRVHRRPELSEGEPAPIRSEGTYLITGGLGTLGRHLGSALVEGGARHLVLTSRQAWPPTQDVDSEETQARIVAVSQWEASGAEVRIIQASAESEKDTARLFKEIAALPPLRGLFHAAGISHNCPLLQETPEGISRVFPPKVSGTWRLHTHTKDLDLDHFVVFSSVSAAWGSHGLTVYAAANHFQDGVIAYRHQQKLPGLTVNWSAWDGGGMASPEYRSWLERLGVSVLDPDKATDLLLRLMGTDTSRVVVSDVQWPIFRSVYEARRARPLLSYMPASHEPVSQQASKTTSQEALPASALARSIAENPHLSQDAVVTDLVTRCVRVVLGFDEAKPVDPQTPLISMGLDSLMAVELRNFLRESGAEVPIARLIGGPSVEEITQLVLAKLQESPPETREGTQVVPSLPSWVTHLGAAILGALILAACWSLIQAVLSPIP